MERKSIHIFLVEDNQGDILLTKEAFEDAELDHRLTIVTDGEQAITYLKSIAEKDLSGSPDMILLDINLPKVNGIEVLKFVKSSEKLRHIPVVMLTTSSFEPDVMESYRNYANCYITKPVEVDEFIAAVTSLDQFWVKHAKLPRSH
ncbi:MAG: response regulator [Balneolales bacterium]|nr:response regulator [Balneolales bacterium]